MEVFSRLRKYLKVRNSLLLIVNKQFLIFLFFLMLSASFWLILALNETMERELSVALHVGRVPRNVVILADVPSQVKFVVRDKGFVLANYIYGGELKPINIDFQNYADGKGRASVSGADLQKMVYQQLYKSSKIVVMKPDKLDLSYTFGSPKKVPVKFSGNIIPASGYYLSHVSYKPDSVKVYAPHPLLDSITTVYTVRQHIGNIKDTVVVNVPLRRIAGAKCEPSSITMTLCPDILAEEKVEVPIEAINLPQDKILRTFPQKVEVHFVVGINRLRTMPISPETKQLLPRGFHVVADYTTIADRHSDKCRIMLSAVPSGVRNAKLETTEVDYIIEQR